MVEVVVCETTKAVSIDAAEHEQSNYVRIITFIGLVAWLLFTKRVYITQSNSNCYYYSIVSTFRS